MSGVIPCHRPGSEGVQHDGLVAQFAGEIDRAAANLASAGRLAAERQRSAETRQRTHVGRIVTVELAPLDGGRQQIGRAGAERAGPPGRVLKPHGSGEPDRRIVGRRELLVDRFGVREVAGAHIVGPGGEQQPRAQLGCALRQRRRSFEPHRGVFEGETLLRQPASLPAVAHCPVVEPEDVAGKIVVCEARHERGVGRLPLQRLGGLDVESGQPRRRHAVEHRLPRQRVDERITAGCPDRPHRSARPLLSSRRTPSSARDRRRRQQAAWPGRTRCRAPPPTR